MTDSLTADPDTPVVPTVDDRLRRAVIRRPTFCGLVGGLVFWWQSLSPTLMPRTWVAQAAMSGVCAAIGIGLGTLGGDLLMAGARRAGRFPGASARARLWQVLAVAAPVVLGVGMILWPRWQNDQRDLVTLAPNPWVQVLPMIVVSWLLCALFVIIGRTVGRGVRRIYRLLRRRFRWFVATPLTLVIVVILATFLFGNVLRDWFEARVNSAFSLVNTGTNEGTERPTSSLQSGGLYSLVRWEDLGVQGRDFVAEATREAELSKFAEDEPVVDPIRVYVGLDSAPTPDARARLAVRELERTGAFDRDVLVVVTVTGTGWVDPDAAVAIEQMYHGNTAMVGQQYSFLPSWIATLLDSEASTEAGVSLFEAVHERWAELPVDSRPKLVVFGQSLGSYGAEAAFAGRDARSSAANLAARTDGALFTGPTNGNIIWNQITDDRESASPVWRPVFDDGETVRFENRDPEVGAADPEWAEPRVLYIQHPTDPVTFWTMDTLWSPPEWMDEPRGQAVPTTGGWFPIVTWTQGVFDLMAGFGAPPGFGHDYRLDFVAGWAQVAPPEGWTATDTSRLEELLHDN